LSLREGIIKLIPKLRQLKYKDLSLNFDIEIQELKEQVDKTELPSIETISVHTKLEPSKNLLFKLCETYPRAAIFESWVLLEAKIGNALQNSNLITNGEKLSSSYSTIKGSEVLFAKNYPSQLNSFNSLKQLRNKVAHGELTDIKIMSAKYFVELAFRLMLFIEDTWPNN